MWWVHCSVCIPSGHLGVVRDAGFFKHFFFIVIKKIFIAKWKGKDILSAWRGECRDPEDSFSDWSNKKGLQLNEGDGGGFLRVKVTLLASLHMGRRHWGHANLRILGCAPGQQTELVCEYGCSVQEEAELLLLPQGARGFVLSYLVLIFSGLCALFRATDWWRGSMADKKKGLTGNSGGGGHMEQVSGQSLQNIAAERSNSCSEFVFSMSDSH